MYPSDKPPAYDDNKPYPDLGSNDQPSQQHPMYPTSSDFHQPTADPSQPYPAQPSQSYPAQPYPPHPSYQGHGAPMQNGANPSSTTIFVSSVPLIERPRDEAGMIAFIFGIFCFPAWFVGWCISKDRTWKRANMIMSILVICLICVPLLIVAVLAAAGVTSSRHSMSY
jgi:hypothetical protein